MTEKKRLKQLPVKLARGSVLLGGINAFTFVVFFFLIWALNGCLLQNTMRAEDAPRLHVNGGRGSVAHFKLQQISSTEQGLLITSWAPREQAL